MLAETVRMVKEILGKCRRAEHYVGLGILREITNKILKRLSKRK